MSLKLPAPTFTTYIPPTTPPLTQFTPAPTCYPTTAGQQMWHVTGLCYPYPHPPGGPARDWEVPRPVCTYTRAGNPQENKPECGNRWGGPGNVEGIIGSCPVGFTSAGLDLGYPVKPFDRTSWGPTPTTEVFDATASAIICCPSVSGLQFIARTTGNVYTHTSTFYNGVLFTMDVPVPYCYAHPATALDKKTVTMGVYHDSRVFDRKAKREERELAQRQESINFADWPWETPGWGGWGDTGKTTTAVFNAQRDTIWADEVRYHYTVFHGTHTCYESCHDYFTNSYYNTDPNFTPTTTPETTTTSTPPVVQSSHAQPSGGFSYPYGGGGGTGSPPYPTNGYDNGAPYPTKAYGHDAPYPTYGNGDGGSGGGGEYKPGKGNEGEGGNKPPVYSGKPPLQSSINEPVQAGASGMRVASLAAMLSTLAVGFLRITLGL